MTIQDDVIALYKSGAKRIVLDEIKPRPTINSVVGVGYSNTMTTADGSISFIRREVLVVYSHLIITADGAFEVPLDWLTDNGSYPSGTAIPSPLPASLINAAGTLQLDIDVQYYEQKRVHAVGYDINGTYQEDQMLVYMGMPFEGAIYQGASKLTYSIWSPRLYMHIAPGITPQSVLDRKDYYQSLGILLI
jgi:hypothetical protein